MVRRKEHDSIWNVAAERVENIVNTRSFLSDAAPAGEPEADQKATNDASAAYPVGEDAVQFLHATTELALIFVEVRLVSVPNRV